MYRISDVLHWKCAVEEECAMSPFPEDASTKASDYAQLPQAPGSAPAAPIPEEEQNTLL